MNTAVRPMPPVTFGLFGLGRIGRRIAERLVGDPAAPRLTAVLVRSDQEKCAAAFIDPALVCTSLDAFLHRRPHVVVECASREALRTCAAPVLASGIDLIPLSLAALADRHIETQIMTAAMSGPGRLEIPAGAMGALDVLAAAREDELSSVTFRAAYPTASWRGTAAETMLRLDQVASRTIFYRGSVRDIASLFPRHVNVAVGVALAGLGLDATNGELIVDPALSQAEFEMDIVAGPGAVDLRVRGRDAQLGADPVDYTTFSILRLLRRRQARVMI
jgi:aspartate dehydrogenase